MIQPTRIIDSHQHVFWHGRDDAGLVADMNEHNVERAWLLTWEIPRAEDETQYHGVLNPIHRRADGTHAGIPLQDLLLTRERYPDRFVVGYCPHPAIGNAPALLESAAKIHDVRVCGEWKFRLLFDDPRCLELFRKAGELGMPVVLHLDVPYLKNEEGESVFQPVWYGGTVENLRRALEACPQTNFVGHAPGFWREISGNADDDPATYPQGAVVEGGRLYDLFEQCPNLYADLSAGSGRYALERDPQHALQFLKRFSDRLLFGRDYYGGELHEFLSTLDLPMDVVEKIYWQNAEKLLAC